MSVKVTVERDQEKPGISLKDGDVCLLRCGGVVMVHCKDDLHWPFRAACDNVTFRQDGTFSIHPNSRHVFDVIEVLGNGADFLKRVEVVVKVRGE